VGYLQHASRWRHHRRYVVPDIAAHLGIGNAAADQVLDAAMDHICPDIHIGASGADDSRPYP
jgi:hypothetical protein